MPLSACWGQERRCRELDGCSGARRLGAPTTGEFGSPADDPGLGTDDGRVEQTPVRRLCEHTFVRWNNLTLTEEEQRRLPGYRDEAVVRRFDAPEALDIRFYEVSARSILNRVPE